MIDRVDNETKEARLFLSQSNCKESEGNNTNVAYLRAHMAKMVTRLIIKYYHELEGHQMGLNYTINHVREKYLVVHHERMLCARRFRSKPAHQQMAPLPKIRLQQTSRPFESRAVDFEGPFLTKQGRGRVWGKLYLCFFSVWRPLLPLRDGVVFGTRCMSWRLCQNDCAERMVAANVDR